MGIIDFVMSYSQSSITRFSGILTSSSTIQISPPGGEDCSLRSSYDRHVRPLIDTIDFIRSIGLENIQYSLPKIAVIGDQSAGKTSCLEALSGIQLPRGNKTVTRVPLEMIMRNHPIWKCSIQYVERGGKLVEEEVRAPEEVDRHVRNAQRRITGNDSDICDKPITLKLESPDVPDLTLIDLPGIIRFVDGNDEIEKDIERLITKYIETETTVILAVFPVSADLATVGALKLARKVDPDLKRTMGVITKLDHADPGSEESVMDTLNNEMVGLGMYGVKNRNQEDLNNNMSWHEARRSETEFFRNHRHFRLVDPSKLGIGNVSERMVKVLTDTIRRALPEIKADVQELLAKTMRELDKLGKGPAENTEARRRELTKILDGCTDSISRMSKGEYRDDEAMDLRLYTDWREETEKFADEIQKITGEVTDDIADQHDHILERLKNQRGSELPGFVKGFPILKSIVRKWVSRYSTAAHEYQHRISVHVGRILRLLAMSQIPRYPKLAIRVKQLVDERHQEARKNTDIDIEKTFAQERYVWTQDRTYNEELRGNKELRDETTQPKTKDEDDQLSREVTKVMTGIIAYMTVAGRRIADTVPLTVLHHSLNVLPDQIREYIMEITASPDEVVDELFEEDTADVRKRKRLENYLKNLQEAEKRLADL